MRPAVPIGEEKMDWVEKLSKERADDARELQKKPRSLASRITAYLNDELSADEMDVLSKAHGPEIDRERMRRDTQAKQKTFRDSENAKILWAGGGSRDEVYQAGVELENFLKSHPEFQSDTPENAQNGQMLREWLESEKLSCTVANLEKAYAGLKSRGEIINVTAEEKAIRGMTAEQFKASRPELVDKRTPPLMRAAVEKALLTFQAFHPEYIVNAKNGSLMMRWLEETQLPPTAGNLDAAFDALRRSGQLELSTAVTQSGSTRFVDYGDIGPHGLPPRPDKASFRKKIEGMTSTEIAEACRLDPAFERAFE
jgi:hypothetical protein